MTFKEFLNSQIKETVRLHNNYRGIVRKDYPKWAGWKIINEHRQNDIAVSEIEDENLEKLVENFYFLQYMKKQIL